MQVKPLETEITDEVLDNWEKHYSISNTDHSAARIIITLIKELRETRELLKHRSTF